MKRLKLHWGGYSRSQIREKEAGLLRGNARLRSRLETLYHEQQQDTMRLDAEIQRLEQLVEAKRTEVEKLRLARPESGMPPSEAAAAPDGRHIGASSRPPVRLGDMLVQRKLISDDQLQAAVDYQQEFGGRLGDILVDLGFLTDGQLAEAVQLQPSKGRLGDMLVQSGLITPEQLNHAIAFQQKSGGMLGDILLSLRLIEPETLYRAIASQYSIGRIGSQSRLDFRVKLPELTARELEAVVIREHPSRYTVAVAAPLKEEQADRIAALLDRPIEQVLATREEMEVFWGQVYESEMMSVSTEKLAREQPHNSASVTFTRSQIGLCIGMGAAFIAGLVWNAMDTLIYLNAAIQVFYFVMTLFKFLIIMYGSRSGAQFRFTDEQLAAIDERDLPVYSILVPMYKESEVIPHLLANLERLDYPKAKLDVRLLIEKDDIEAQQLLGGMDLPSCYTVLVVPDSLPKTKPKACNFGLIRARGKYVVIYDAEDRPDPDQLKKVHLTFEACSDETVCVQGKLNYFNSEQNLLTRWFTQEYSMWFELLLPGIMKLDIPIPLGGTSNHFKTDVLKRLDAWDPYNVTEDADLGIRLYKEGYKTAIVDSRTWEEANSRFGNWIRQRSRWIKGYMQTWLVHMRNPFKLLRDLGFRGFMGFQVMVLATPLIPLLNPIFWGMILLWYGWHLDVIPRFFPGIIYYLSSIELFIANFFFIFSNIAGVYWVINDLEKRGEDIITHRLVKYALLTPLYWMMMSVAAYKAAWQLITKPFYWEKTTHGLDSSGGGQPPASMDGDSPGERAAL